MMNFARNFTALRKKMGISQEQLAEKCGVSRSALAKWEAGNTIPDVYHICNAAKIFGVTVDELLNGKMDPVTDNTMDAVYDKLNEMQRVILAAIEKRGTEFDLYTEYCQMRNERAIGDEVFEIEEKAEAFYVYGIERAEEGHYSEAVALLEEALTYGAVRAADVLMSIHNDILDLIASEQNDSKYWSYRLEVAQKMQAYGKIVEEEITNGNVF